ncbi:OmpA family protein [Variovorax saccharolyticus]|uniref:OmpA family protein n=1 Tax=Variovorax saccharolyticus TaxID=3053516 RepID=UPI002577E615|nr:OmpA family protein [Variovorax sp. J31P216]MDM0028305.1 OmpA family protein [Variovorax sp. J31P216]
MQIERRANFLDHFFHLFLGALLAIGLTGCATRYRSDELQSFDQAIVAATDALLRQPATSSALLPLGAAPPDRRVVVLDPTLDAGSGQQTAGTQRLDRTIAAHAGANFKQIEILTFKAANLPRAQYLLAGTLARQDAGLRIHLALVDLKDGTVAAQASTLARVDDVDMTPLAYYRDSPVLVKDEVIEGLVRTSRAGRGERADATYLGYIATATVINDATQLYNAGRYREALAHYRRAAATPGGEQIRVLNGIYLTTLKLGQSAEAEDAFGRVVAYGIAHNQLGVKFLFNPGSTDFWSDPRVTSAYRMWLRQIAKQGGSARVCMDIVGHSSKTGPEEVNDSLSLRRAQYIRQRLAAESAELADRTRPKGQGSRQNLVGSGTDDVVDALDRRVEFAIVECGR